MMELLLYKSMIKGKDRVAILLVQCWGQVCAYSSPMARPARCSVVLEPPKCSQGAGTLGGTLGAGLWWEQIVKEKLELLQTPWKSVR